MKSEIPKGMLPPVPESPESADKAPERPAPLTLADGNYAGAIRQVLEVLPVSVRVDRFLILERNDRPPEVRLSLTILGEKEGANDGSQQD